MTNARRMRRPGLCAVLAGLAAALAAHAQPAQQDQQAAREKLLTYRAARADAVRRLGERIEGLSIDARTTVEEFVASSDRIDTSMQAWLSGMREVDGPTYEEDGLCRVTMEVALDEVVRRLEEWHATLYTGQSIKRKDLQRLGTQPQRKVLREVGSAAPRSEPVEAMFEPELVETDGGPMRTSKLSDKAKAFWFPRVTGRGRLLAERAARIDAMRRLAERVKGLRVDARTSVSDFVADSDRVEVHLQTFLRGAREVGMRYHDDELIVEVVMQVKLRTIFAEIRSWAKGRLAGDDPRLKRIEHRVLTAEDTVVGETGFGVPPAAHLTDAQITSADRKVLQLVGHDARGVPAWATETLRQVGQATIDLDAADSEAAAKLLAFRAAQIDARRKLAQALRDLSITRRTTVGRFASRSERIDNALMVFLQGVRVVESSKTLGEDGLAELAVEVDLKDLWNLILHYQRELDLTIE